MHLYSGSHVGGQKNANQPIFPYNVMKNSPISFAHNSVFYGPTSNLVQKHVMGLTGYIKIWEK